MVEHVQLVVPMTLQMSPINAAQKPTLALRKEIRLCGHWASGGGPLTNHHDRGDARSFWEIPSRAPTITATMLVRRLTRSFASIASNSPPPSFNTTGPYQVFDRNAKTLQRNRAALRDNGERSRTVDYVREEVAERMMERFLVWRPFTLMIHVL